MSIAHRPRTLPSASIKLQLKSCFSVLNTVMKSYTFCQVYMAICDSIGEISLQFLSLTAVQGIGITGREDTGSSKDLTRLLTFPCYYIKNKIVTFCPNWSNLLSIFVPLTPITRSEINKLPSGFTNGNKNFPKAFNPCRFYAEIGLYFYFLINP